MIPIRRNIYKLPANLVTRDGQCCVLAMTILPHVSLYTLSYASQLTGIIPIIIERSITRVRLIQRYI